MTTRGQSGLEYLIIIAAIIAIASISIVVLSKSSSSSSKTLGISTCKQAATECALARAVSSKDTCTKCEKACTGSSGEIFSNAIDLCKAGNSSGIYEGAGDS